MSGGGQGDAHAAFCQAKLGEIGRTGPDQAAGAAPSRRKRLLTLGGCNTLEIGKKLAWLYDHTHIWNVTWPSLASPPFPLLREPDEAVFDAIRSFAKRDAAKTDAERIRTGGFDIILTTLQFTHLSFVLRNGACIVDFTAPFFAKTDSEDERPDIRAYAGADARIVTWEDADFAELILDGFDRVYDEVFEPVLRAGSVVVVYDHILSQTELTPEGEIPYGPADIATRVALSKAIADRIRNVPGIQLLETNPAFAATSADAPWERWDYHPVEEQYVDLAWRLARLAGDEVQDAVIERHLRSLRQRLLAKDRALDQAAAALARAEEQAADRLEEVRRKAGEAQRHQWQAARLRAELEATRQTLSWRVTSPLRAVRRLARRARSAVGGTRPAAKPP